MKIKNLTINSDSKALIIAEISANHGHSLEIAKKTILAAKEAGANAMAEFLRKQGINAYAGSRLD